jgi:hypothetical protein
LGEEIGVVDRDTFEEIICNVVDKANRKRDAKHEHTHPEVVLKKRMDALSV